MHVFEAPDSPEWSDWIERILDADDLFLQEHPESSLFAYFSGRPDKSVLERSDLLSAWRRRGGRAAAARGGERRGVLPAGAPCPRRRSSSRTSSREGAGCRAEADRLQAEVEAFRSGLLYSTTSRVLDADLMRRACAHTMVRAIERRVRAVARRSG